MLHLVSTSGARPNRVYTDHGVRIAAPILGVSTDGTERPLSRTAIGRGCVKTQNNFVERNIDLSKRSLCDFLDIGNGIPTHEVLSDLRFYTASASKRPLCSGGPPAECLYFGLFSNLQSIIYFNAEITNCAF